jgi:hypothetical protein
MLRIMYEQRNIRTTVPSGLPVAFGPVEIKEAYGLSNEARYQATVTWEIAGSRGIALGQLRELADAKNADVAGRVQKVTITLQYHDQTGKLTGSEQVVLGLDTDQGSISLRELGKRGPVFSMTATIESFTLVSRRGTTTVVS